MDKETKLENALYVVATPIGNLSDITLRALEVLTNADFIFCEDTRKSAKLLQAYQIINKKLLIYNDHNEQETLEKIFLLLAKGHSCALISDAGTPLISDPGYRLVKFLQEKNQKIIPIPGPSSLTATLCVSGLSCNQFLFIGFLPTSKIQKEKLFKNLPKNFTIACFESANRLVETIEIINQTLGSRQVCIARELTKIYEEFLVDTPNNLLTFFQNHPEKIRGELVILIEKLDKSEKEFTQEDLLKDIATSISAGHSVKEISQNLSEIYGINKKEVYQLALDLINKK